ncbi:MAG TPA: ABC-F family ATP-binding cassette domain-containing protein [Candidatus Saccharimonas sp.]|nr:ABC-F family ATP-binding cassette domain-containing protein [Candidatus Saccharimonas sp.]
MLTVQHLYKTYKNKTILQDVHLSVDPREVIALIGENGAGKTTLLSIITGQNAADSGTITVQGETVGYVPQQIPLGLTIADNFRNEFEPWQMHYALSLVDLTAKSLETPVAALSGGQKTRLAFATVLVQNPTVLLLDEPTNNLDAKGLAWLERLIATFRGGVLIASHDRTFINRVATGVVALQDGTLRHYGGNYDFYKQQKAAEHQTELAEYESFVAEKKRLQKIKIQKTSLMQQTTQERYSRLKGVPKISFNKQKNESQRSLGGQLRALDSKLSQLATIERPQSSKDYAITLGGDVPNDKLVLRLTVITKSYSTSVLQGVSLEIRGHERIRIAGKNGAGKTTLLKIAAGLLQPNSGDVKLGQQVNCGYFSQDSDGLDYKKTALENLVLTLAQPEAIHRAARSLGLTNNDLKKRVPELSRGQQAKLGFAKLLLSNYHLLILDEPTNHLDIATREHIELALSQYKGAVLFTSHDDYFADAVHPTKTLYIGSNC